MSRQRNHILWFIIALLGSGSVRADELGRLFTSVADRTRIDTQSDGQVQSDTPENVPPPDRQVVNGTIIGSGGKRLVWLNGVQVFPGRGADKVLLLRDGRVRLPWREGAQSRELKPGQGLDQISGEVFELYARAPASTPAPVPAPTPTAAFAASAPAATPAPQTPAVPATTATEKATSAVAKDKLR